MTVNLIATGRPCEVCEVTARRADDGAAPELHHTTEPLEPREVAIPPTPADTIPEGAIFTYKTGDGYLGTAPDRQVFRVERDGKDVGTFCAKCLRAACDAAAGSGSIGIEVIVAMRTRARGAPP